MELIVVMVILSILAAIMVPTLIGWIDKAKETRLIIACRTCVISAQTLASEAYGKNGTKTPPYGAEVIDLAGVPGIASNISLDTASNVVNTLTYSENGESVTYMRLPTPKYISGTGIDGEIATASNWAQQYMKPKPSEANEWLTIHFGEQNPPALTKAQMELIFGNLELERKPQYIYPMAIYDKSGKVLDIQYVTPQNPSKSKNQNRYTASAFIIDGKKYICTLKNGDKVRAVVNATNKPNNSFQKIMNNESFESTQDFVDFITTNGGYYKLAE